MIVLLVEDLEDQLSPLAIFPVQTSVLFLPPLLLLSAKNIYFGSFHILGAIISREKIFDEETREHSNKRRVLQHHRMLAVTVHSEGITCAQTFSMLTALLKLSSSTAITYDTINIGSNYNNCIEFLSRI